MDSDIFSGLLESFAMPYACMRTFGMPARLLGSTLLRHRDGTSACVHVAVTKKTQKTRGGHKAAKGPACKRAKRTSSTALCFFLTVLISMCFYFHIIVRFCGTG